MEGAYAVRTVRKKPRSPAWVFVPLATAFVIIAGIAIYGVVSPYDAKSPPAPGTRGALVWGDGIFSTRVQLRAWLRNHGTTYEEFAKTHPAAVRLMKPLPKRSRAALAKAHKKAKPTTPVKKVAAAPTLTTTTKSHGAGIWLVVGFGLLLGLIAATPHRLLARVGVHIESREREVRVAAIGAGAALLLGVIAATIVG